METSQKRAQELTTYEPYGVIALASCLSLSHTPQDTHGCMGQRLYLCTSNEGIQFST